MCDQNAFFEVGSTEVNPQATWPVQLPQPVQASSPLQPGQPMPVEWEWWRCLRLGGISGLYDCVESGSPLPGAALELRLDVDVRRANSPVMSRVSGDFYNYRWRNVPGFPPKLLRVKVYRESWIIDSPKVTWSRCSCAITGNVRFWNGVHLATSALIEVNWSGGKTTATAKFTALSSTTTYAGDRTSDCFRSMNLEVDVCASVNAEPILPSYDTHWHPTRPADLPRRVLTLQEAYREAGVNVTLRPDRTIVNDSAAQFSTWSVGELHDAMETHFSQIGGTWPKWEMWGVLVGRFDSAGTAGIMFDAAAAYGGAGEPPDRQGFAVARKHSWFNSLVTGTPATTAQADAMRQYLYTWVHEAGHAFNFLHSWNKGRPNAFSWMNYPHQVANFWDSFRLRFDDEELVHMRHADRASVIMGGDAWASGGHLEDTTLGSMLSQADDTAGEGAGWLEVTLRAKPYFDFMEPVTVEVRLRNPMADTPVEVDARLRPEFGRLAVLIQRPDGRVVDCASIFCMAGDAEPRLLQGAKAGKPGEDRYSEQIALTYGKNGFLFAEPGEYRLRAYYHAPDDMVYPSNPLRLRIGRPFSREEDRMACGFFSKGVGLILALGDHRSPHLDKGRGIIEEAIGQSKGSRLAAQLSLALASSLVQSFHTLVAGKAPGTKDVKLVAKADPEELVVLSEPALALCQKDKSKDNNLTYHRVVRLRAKALKQSGKGAQAKKEVAKLRGDLEKRDVNPPVLAEIQALENTL